MPYDGGKYGDAVLARRPIVASRSVPPSAHAGAAA
jgi:hypothetical protein